MISYNYVARDQDGAVVRSSCQAASRLEALAALRERGLTVVDLFSPQDEQGVKKTVARTPARASGLIQVSAVGLADVAEFSRLMATSVAAGIPLRDALEAIADDSDKAALRKVLLKLVAHLHAGQSFSDALAHYPRVFSKLFVSLVRSAEESGSMPGTLNQLSLYLERYEKLRRKVRAITAYPMFIMVFFCVVCVIMTLLILPRFQEAFSSFDAELPRLTQAVFAFNTFVLNHRLEIGLVVVAGALLFFVLRALPSGRYQLDRFKLKLPFFGMIVRKFAIARLSRNLAVMLRGGVPITTALDITSSVTGNKVLEASLIKAKERIMAGSDIYTSLRADPEFPRLFVRMVSVGESSGQLPEILEQLSDVYEERVEAQILVATTLFEPIIICLFGFIVLILILAVYLPIFTMSSHVQ